MAKITFVAQYDNFSVGCRIMSNILRNNGHTCSIVFFKMPNLETIPHHTRLQNIKHVQLTDGVIYGEGYVASNEPWTDVEIDLLIEKLKDDDPDIIGLSARSLHDHDNRKFINTLKQALPGKIFIAGGFGPTFNPEIYLENADYVVFGEGESPMLDIANAFDNKEPFDAIFNLIYKKDNQVIRNEVRCPENDLDSLPFPDYDNPDFCYIHENKLYKRDPSEIYPNWHPVLLGRGCLGACSYCSIGQWRGIYKDEGHFIKPRRLRSIDNVIEELKIVKLKGKQHLQFLDSYLVGPKKYFLEFLQRYKDEIGLPFVADLQPIQMLNSPDLFRAFCDAGLSEVSLPLQHGSESFRKKYLNRKTANQLILKVADLYTENNIQIDYHLMAGIPFETETSLTESLDMVKKLPMKNGHIFVQLLWHLPKTPLTKRIIESNLDEIYDFNKWYATVMLYYFRTILNDEAFAAIFSKAKKIIFDEKYKEEFKNGIPEIFQLFLEQLKQSGTPISGDPAFLFGVYEAYLSEKKDQPILVWGPDYGFIDTFPAARELLKKYNIKAYINPHTKRNAIEFNGTKISDESILAEENLPILICTMNKSEIVKKIEMNYPLANKIF